MRSGKSPSLLACAALLAASEFSCASPLAGRPLQPAFLDIGCTRAGLWSRSREQGQVYPVMLRFTGSRGQAVGNVIITVSHADGRDATTLVCPEPHVIMRLAAGRYMASVDMEDGPQKTLDFHVTPGAETIVMPFPSITVRAPRGPDLAVKSP